MIKKKQKLGFEEQMIREDLNSIRNLQKDLLININLKINEN